MRKAVIGMAVVVMVCGLAVQADIITIQDTTADGSSPTVRDGGLSCEFDARNYGRSTSFWQITDDYTSGELPAHTMYWFDLSSLNPAWTINSATFGVYMSGAISNLKLSRFSTGKDWIEGVHSGTLATTGEPSWWWRIYKTIAWTAPRGGSGDVDTGTTQTFTPASGAGYKTRDVTTWVMDWVNGTAENNGMLLWGGTGETYKTVYFSEYATVSMRPYLTVDYTIPEPVTVLLLAVGLVPMLRRRRCA